MTYPTQTIGWWSVVVTSAACFAALLAGCSTSTSQLPPVCHLLGINRIVSIDTVTKGGVALFELTCELPFTISVAGYGGDTTHIHFEFIASPDSARVLHDVQVTGAPWKTSILIDTAWMAVKAVYQGTPSFDTCWAFMPLPK